MYIATTFDPSVKVADTFNTKLPIDGKFVLSNQSNINLTLIFADGSTAYAPAWQITSYVVPTSSPNVKWSQQSILAGTTPISQVVVVAYLPNEQIPGTYPASIQHTAYVPNQVSTSSMVNTLSNENNAANTEIIDIGTVNNSKLIDIFNDHFIWFVEQAGVKHQVLQGRTAGKPLLLGDPLLGDHVEVAGKLDVDLDLYIVRFTTLDNGNITTDANGNITAVSYSDGNGRGRIYHPLVTPYQIHNNGTVNVGSPVTNVQITGNGGIPSGATSVVENWYFSSATVSAFMKVIPSGSTPANNSDYPIMGLIPVANNIMCFPSVNVPLSSLGRYDVVATNGNIVGIYASIMGYYI